MRYKGTVTVPYTVEEELDTKHCDTLSVGDEFKYQPTGRGGDWEWFIFHGVATRGEHSWVRAYGGDPLRDKFEHRRQWRSFSVSAIVDGARHPYGRRKPRQVSNKQQEPDKENK